MFLSGDSKEDTDGASSLLFFILFSYPVNLIQVLLLIISFSSFQIPFHAVAPLNLSLLAIQLFRSAEDISEDSCVHSTFVQPIPRVFLLSGP